MSGIGRVAAAFAEAGLCFETAVHDCTELVLFGSRAAGCARVDSDTDVLCIGPGTTWRRSGLDAVYVSHERLASREWRSSELASHVVEYGVWIKGTGEWRRGVTLRNGHAADRKAIRIRGMMRALERSVGIHGAVARAWTQRISDDVMRWGYLRSGTPVPPTVLLRRWGEDRPAEVGGLARELGCRVPAAHAR